MIELMYHKIIKYYDRCSVLKVTPMLKKLKTITLATFLVFVTGSQAPAWEPISRGSASKRENRKVGRASRSALPGSSLVTSRIFAINPKMRTRQCRFPTIDRVRETALPSPPFLS